MRKPCTLSAYAACRAQMGAPPLSKEVGAELGCVTPYIVTPGAWTQVGPNLKPPATSTYINRPDLSIP